MDGDYYPARAQALADCRRDSKSPWKMSDPTIAAYVKDGLKCCWTPEQIAGRMNVDHPADETKRISHATIYRWIYEDKRQGGRCGASRTQAIWAILPVGRAPR